MHLTSARLRAAAAALLVAAGLAACGGSQSTGDAGQNSGGGGGSQGANSTSIAIGLTAEPENLDFSTTDGAAIPQALLYNVYEGLVKEDPDGKVVPLLAKSYTLSKDRKTYTFKLQSDVKFSNGAKFTASDVKFSIDRVKSPAWKISLKSYMDVVKNVTVVSPTVVKVTLSHPSNNWLFEMTTRIGAMYTPNGVSNLANKPIGTGPYVLQNWIRGDSIILKANPNYWGKAPAMKQVTLKYIADPTALNNALLSGQIQVIDAVTAPDSLAQFTSNPKYTVIQGVTNGEVTCALNNKSGPFKDQRVREAVSYAINRKAVLDTSWAGKGVVIGSMVPPTDPWYENLSSIHAYNPTKAKQLLAAAGKKNLTIRFEVPNLPYATSAAQVIKSELSQVGITAKIDILEFPARWLSQVFTQHNYDMSIVNHVEPRDIYTFGIPTYYWGYDNPTVTKLLTAADEGTPAVQVTDLKRVARTLSEQAAAVWLYNFPNLVVADKGIAGLPKNGITESLDLSQITRSAG